MYAIIDIGTNSTLLLIGKKETYGKVRILADEVRINRIGEHLSIDDSISPSAIKKTIDVLKEYRDICEKHNATKVVAVGTAALRTAKNSDEVLHEILKQVGLDVEVITPDKEAWYTFIAAMQSFGKDIMVCDIGGGSTELTWGILKKTDNKDSCQFISTNLGSVSLTEKILKSDPVTKEELQDLCSTIDGQIQKALALCTYKHASTLVATSGTATTIAAIYKKLPKYDPQKIHGTKVTMLDIQVIINNLKERTIAERRKIIGMQKGREDISLAGVVILGRIMRRFGYNSVTISDHGLRWGILYEQLLKGDVTPLNNILK